MIRLRAMRFGETLVRSRAARFGETSSRRVRRHRFAVAAVALMFGAGAVGIATWGPPAPDREIRLVARGTAFYLESDGAGTGATPNPTLTVRAGERVRIVLENDDRGMTHDFAVPAISQALDAIDWKERGEVVFDVPAAPGEYEYVCRPHLALKMKGTLRVTQ